ncbi:hypothetical protein [Mycoplasma simbae]|uniref:hypothetical protein n=1 Tax=Mycoplasma simbae TaxID=36744 RepID=UPI000495B9D8|nr:hypothetical protein [Mycoplasma simbae]
MLRNYFQAGFSKLRTIHFVVVLSIGLILGASVLIYQSHKGAYESNYRFIVSDALVVMGCWYLAYGTILISIRKGLGSSLRSMSQNKRDAKIKREMNRINSRNNLSSQDKISLRIMQQNLEENQAKDLLKEQSRSNQLIYMFLIAIGIVVLVTGIILIYA